MSFSVPLHIEACMVVKISWPPVDLGLSVSQWFHIVRGEDGVVLGTSACHALGIIDDKLPLTTLTQGQTVNFNKNT